MSPEYHLWLQELLDPSGVGNLDAHTPDDPYFRTVPCSQIFSDSFFGFSPSPVFVPSCTL